MGIPEPVGEPPWDNVFDDEELTWFTLGSTYNLRTTYADFFTLFLLSYLYKSVYIKKQTGSLDNIELHENTDNEKTDEEIESYQSRKQLETIERAKHIMDSDSDIEMKDQMLIAIQDMVEDPLAEKPEIFEVNSWRDRIVYMLFRYSPHFILLFMFIAATVEANLLSFGYVLFSLFFLYKDNWLYRKKNKLWRWGRVYNFAVLVIVVVFQFPYFPSCTPNCTDTCPSCDPYAIQPIIGLYKFEDTSYVFSTQGILFDLIIFLLMSLQAVIFDTSIFQRVANHIIEERTIAVFRAKLKYLQFLRKEARAIKIIEAEKQRRTERLDKIHKYRAEKQYLIASSIAASSVESANNEEILKQGEKSEDSSELIIAPASEFKQPILGVPERDSPLSTSEEEEISLKSELHKEHEIEKEIDSLYTTIEDFLVDDDDNLSETSDSSSLNSDDKKTTKDKLRAYYQKGVYYYHKIYNAIYERIVKYLYNQTFENPDPNQSKFQVCLRGVYHYCLNRSHILCYVAFILNNLVYANLLSLVYPTLAFAFALMESPIPSRLFWRFCIVYTYTIIILKFVFQISVFCICYSAIDWDFWCIQPFCSDDKYSFCSLSYQDNTTILKNLPELFGIIKMTQFFALEVGMDLLVLFTLLLHRNISKKSGLWIYLSDRDETIFNRYLKQKEIKEEKIAEKKEKKKKKKEKIKEYKKQRKEEEKRLKREKKAAKKAKKKGPSIIEEDNTTESDIEKISKINLEKTTKEEKLIDDNDDDIHLSSSFESKNEKLFDDDNLSPKRDNTTYIISTGNPDIPLVMLPPPSDDDEHKSLENEDDIEFTHDISSLSEISIDKKHNKFIFDEEDEEDEEDDEDDDYYEKVEGEAELDISKLNIIPKVKTNLSKIKFYYSRVLSHKATAKDYYVQMVTVQVLAFFYMLLAQNAFSYNPPSEYSFILLESRIPTSFFLMLLFQFLFIIIDRVIYLFRSILAKIIMQYFTLFYYTLMLFFVLPNGRGEQFDEIIVLILFYGMQCIYWWISALQICEGYPVNIQKRWITKSYNMIHRYIFEVYLIIPFLFELRSLLDWTIFDTTLNFFQFMKLEDIYRNVYQVKCKRKAEESSDWYQKQGKLTKNAVGALAFIGLIVLLWFPLFLLSSANPTNQPNGVVSATFDITVTGFPALYHNNQDQNINYASDEQFDTIRQNFKSVSGDEEYDTQVIDLRLVCK